MKEFPPYTPPTAEAAPLVFAVSIDVADQDREAVEQAALKRLHALGDLAVTGEAQVYNFSLDRDPQYQEFLRYKERQAAAERLLDNAGLTETQRRIATLVKYGKSNQQMAEYLDVSMGTIKTHLSRIYEKLGIYDRYEIAALLNGATREEWADPLGLKGENQSSATETPPNRT